jgi:membrane dipeptidase
VDHPRNVPDSILQRLPKNGGVVMVTFVTSFVSKAAKAWSDAQTQAAADAGRRLGSDTAAVRRAMDEWTKANPQPKVMLTEVADHIDHVKRVAGVNHVGIGSDFDGITDVVVGLEDVSTFPSLFAELSRRGWTEADLRKLAGENVLRALKQAEVVAARIKKQRPPSTKTIQAMDGRVAQ